MGCPQSVSLTVTAFLSLSISSCSRPRSDSFARDIFLEDQDTATARRRAATPVEKHAIINVRGCTGHLLAPTLMMTASHCRPTVGARYRSGVALNLNLEEDIAVAEIIESNSALDYAILKIVWDNGYPEEQKFPPRITTSAADVVLSTEADQGDEVYTVGFPQDTQDSWGATYARGRLKKMQSTNRLAYNIGIINGNSGGPVYRVRDQMLVSLTNGGPRMFGQTGWNTGSAQEEGHWNNGVAMWLAYQASPTLQDIFPAGENRFSNTSVDEEPVDEEPVDEEPVDEEPVEEEPVEEEPTPILAHLPQNEVCQIHGVIKVCQGFNEGLSGGVHFTMTIFYTGMLRQSSNVDAYVKLNGRDGTFPMQATAEGYQLDLTNGFLQCAGPTVSDCRMAPDSMSQLFYFATWQGRTNVWDVEFAFVDEGGNWDSDYGENYRMNFAAR